MTRKPKFNPVPKKSGGGIRGTISNEFTSAEQLKNNFFAHTSVRQAQKVSSDGTYWNGGCCEWGGSHNLMEDCQELANFFNSIANINNDIQEITLATDEQDFNRKKQNLISKIQGCINKCQTTSYYSVASVCCIWDDFFGSFLKGFLDNFQRKLQSQLAIIEKIEAKHQKAILKLEAEIREAEAKYQENFTKAQTETDPTKKARFIALANEALDEVSRLKDEYKRNPIASLSKYDYLSDLQRLINGDISSDPPTQPSSGNINSPSNAAPLGNNGGNGGGSNWNPFRPNSSNNDNQNQSNQQQLFIYGAIALIIIYFLLNQKETNEY